MAERGKRDKERASAQDPAPYEGIRIGIRLLTAEVQFAVRDARSNGSEGDAPPPTVEDCIRTLACLERLLQVRYPGATAKVTSHKREVWQPQVVGGPLAAHVERDLSDQVGALLQEAARYAINGAHWKGPHRGTQAVHPPMVRGS